MLPALAITAALGLLLLTLGLRGRRTDDHPICRRCRFDLIGTHPASQTCPECGADLTKPVATRTGRRRKRPLPFLAGTLLTGISVGASLAIIWPRAAAFDWNSVKPFWWLTIDAESAHAATAAAALTELTARIRAGHLDAPAVEPLALLALEHQSAREVLWEPRWGDLVEAARASSLLPDDLWRRYATGGVHLSLAPRSPVRAGDPTPFTILREYRFATETTLSVWARCHLPSVDGITALAEPWSPEHPPIDPDRPPHAGTLIHPRPRGVSDWRISTPDIDPAAPSFYRVEWAAPARAGRSNLAVLVDLYVHESNQDIGMGEPPSRYISHQTIGLTAPFDVVPSDTDPVQFVTDATLARSVTAAVSLQKTSMLHGRETDTAHGFIRFGPMPVGAAFDVYWRAGDREWFAGRIALADTASRGGDVRGYVRTLDDFDSNICLVDVVLRPSPDAARATPDLFEIWGQPIEFRDVRVEQR